MANPKVGGLMPSSTNSWLDPKVPLDKTMNSKPLAPKNAAAGPHRFYRGDF